MLTDVPNLGVLKVLALKFRAWIQLDSLPRSPWSESLVSNLSKSQKWSIQETIRLLILRITKKLVSETVLSNSIWGKLSTYHCFDLYIFRGEETILSLGGYPQTDAIEVFDQEKLKVWPLRDSNTQPSDLESDALPLRQGVLMTDVKFMRY